MRLFTATIDTPVGPLDALASDEGLCALEFTASGRSERLERRRKRWFPTHTIEPGETRVTQLTREWLDDYFAGRRLLPARLMPCRAIAADPTVTSQPQSDRRATVQPPDGELALTMFGTDFELRVWGALLDIGAGDTTSYGEIARRLGAPGASRAVGLANGANPIPIIVPCHRVIGSSGSLVGYGGGMERKRWLLDHERSRYSRSLLNAAAL